MEESTRVPKREQKKDLFPLLVSKEKILTLWIGSSKNVLVECDEVDRIRSTQLHHSLLHKAAALDLWREIWEREENVSESEIS